MNATAGLVRQQVQTAISACYTPSILAAGERGSAVMSELRAYVFRQKAFEAETKACREHITDSTRRAWLIVAREWTKMAEKEEAAPNGERHAAPSRRSF